MKRDYFRRAEMREILFRGKREGSGEWAYGYYVAADNKPYIFTGKMGLSQVTAAHRLMYKDFERYEVIPETVGQYTGLKDKNGARIFEGDIVEYKTLRLLVRFAEEYGCFTVDDKFWMSAYNEFDIIGNAHDSPELLGRE
jgi:uncharacterized phage protein (TIGR01671 family)